MRRGTSRRLYEDARAVCRRKGRDTVAACLDCGPRFTLGDQRSRARILRRRKHAHPAHRTHTLLLLEPFRHFLRVEEVAARKRHDEVSCFKVAETERAFGDGRVAAERRRADVQLSRRVGRAQRGGKTAGDGGGKAGREAVGKGSSASGGCGSGMKEGGLLGRLGSGRDGHMCDADLALLVCASLRRLPSSLRCRRSGLLAVAPAEDGQASDGVLGRALGLLCADGADSLDEDGDESEEGREEEEDEEEVEERPAGNEVSTKRKLRSWLAELTKRASPPCSARLQGRHTPSSAFRRRHHRQARRSSV